MKQTQTNRYVGKTSAMADGQRPTCVLASGLLSSELVDWEDWDVELSLGQDLREPLVMDGAKGPAHETWTHSVCWVIP